MRLAIFETHPIQYRAPVYKELAKLKGDDFEVIYASEFSIRGYRDEGFGEKISWNTNLLDGYLYRVLHCDRPGGIQRFRGLSGVGVQSSLMDLNPRAILLHSFGYEFCMTALAASKRRKIPVWLRSETQDNAFSRSFAKSLIRRTIYCSLYKCISKFFAIGELNRNHYLNHGVNSSQILYARYCTPNPINRLSRKDKLDTRERVRASLDIKLDQLVVAFFGKLIPKKNPEILFQAIQSLPESLRQKVVLLYVGDGELLTSLQQQNKQSTTISHFVGFVNQEEIPDYYLASDIVVLPSRQMGETWGLVVNEALNSGCAVVTSDAVGCSHDFRHLERFRVFSVGDVVALSAAIVALGNLPRDFDWSIDFMQRYSVEAAAKSIANEMESF